METYSCPASSVTTGVGVWLAERRRLLEGVPRSRLREDLRRLLISSVFVDSVVDEVLVRLMDRARRLPALRASLSLLVETVRSLVLLDLRSLLEDLLSLLEDRRSILEDLRVPGLGL